MQGVFKKNFLIFYLKDKWTVFFCFLLLVVLASILFQRNESITVYDDEQVGPTLAEDPFLRGQYYFNADADPAPPYDLLKARQAYEEVLNASSSSHSLAWYQLGRIDFLEGKYDNAINKFQKQIAFFGDQVPSVYYMIGLTYGYKARATNDPQDWQKGAEGFQKYIEIVPHSPWARTDLAWIYFSQGKFEEMTPVLEEGLEIHPDHPWLHNMYGLALMNTGDSKNAKMHFDTALIGAKKLSPEEWGNAYPGNNPASWSKGLDSFIDAIEKNRQLVSEEPVY